MDWTKEEICYAEGAETLEQAPQRNCGGLIMGSVPDQAGWSSELPHLMKDDPVHGGALDWVKVLST